MNPMQLPLEIHSPAIPLFLGRPALEPVSLSGLEGVNSLFEYRLLLQTPETLHLDAARPAEWDLEAFIGTAMQCTIQLDGAGRYEPGTTGPRSERIGAGQRQINALVSEAQSAGMQGRHYQYLLVLRPWLHRATQTCQCRVFQNRTVVEVLDQVLAAYAYPVEKRLRENYPQRDLQIQFNESDFDFFSRLTQEYGINYWFEHAAGAHTLVLGDHMDAFGATAHLPVEFHPPGWRPDAEYLHAFVEARPLAPGAYETSDYDYSRPRADLSQFRGDPDAAGQAAEYPLTVSQWHAPMAGSHYAQPRAGSAPANDPFAEGAFFARLRLEELRTHVRRARASGNLRNMVPGRGFILACHPRRQANTEYLVLDTDFTIENAGQESQARDPVSGRTQGWRVTVKLVAHPLTETLRPASTHPKPRPLTHQTATVSGPQGESIHTDVYGRIKVRFHWDKTDRDTAGGAFSSCWLRVATSWAGNQMGFVQIPRIGQEVCVGFINDDIDQPICLHSLANDLNRPPFELPGQAALSGMRSRELGPKGAGNFALGRSNHMVLDDTPDEIQAQLKSDHQHSQLSLGWIRRIEDNEGRKDARGEGFDLRTDGHGVLRAGAGLLLTTEMRPRAAGHAKALRETAVRLEAGRDLQARLAASARQAGAQNTEDQNEVARAMQAQNQEIRGPEVGASSKAGDFPELARPHLVLASAAGISSTSAGDTHIASGGHVALGAESHASISAGRSFLASARDAIRMFAFRAGIRMVAAGGDIDIKAIKHNIALLARMDIRLQGDSIHINATREVLINAGGSYLRINASGITPGTAGSWKVRAGTHGHTDEDSLPVEEGGFPAPDFERPGSDHRRIQSD